MALLLFSDTVYTRKALLCFNCLVCDALRVILIIGRAWAGHNGMLVYRRCAYLYEDTSKHHRRRRAPSTRQ